MELKQLPLLQHRPITVALLMLTAANLEVEEVAANRGVCELALQLLIPEILPANSLKEALELEKIRVQIPENEKYRIEGTRSRCEDLNSSGLTMIIAA